MSVSANHLMPQRRNYYWSKFVNTEMGMINTSIDALRFSLCHASPYPLFTSCPEFVSSHPFCCRHGYKSPRAHNPNFCLQSTGAEPTIKVIAAF